MIYFKVGDGMKEVKENVKIDEDFKDLKENENKKMYTIVGILYFIVIVLVIFLVIGVKHQKDTVENNINNKKSTNYYIMEEE